jgi:hypothetical protein
MLASGCGPKPVSSNQTTAAALATALPREALTALVSVLGVGARARFLQHARRLPGQGINVSVGSPDAASGEHYEGESQLPDGRKYRRFSGGKDEANRRGVTFTAAGHPVGEAISRTTGRWPNSNPRSVESSLTCSSPDGALELKTSQRVDFTQDGTGATLVALSLHFAERATGRGLDSTAVTLAPDGRELRYAVIYDKLGLRARVVANAVGADSEGGQGPVDVLGAREGSAHFEKTDGSTLFDLVAAREGGRLMRTYTFPGGLVLKLDGTSRGSASLPNSTPDTAELILADDGAVGLRIGSAIMLGVDAAGQATTSLPTAGGPDEVWRVDTLAGDGTRGFADGATGAQLNQPMGLAKGGKYFYLADGGNARVRRFTLDEVKDGLPSAWLDTLAGGSTGTADGRGDLAGFEMPRGLVATEQDQVYVLDGNRLRTISPDGQVQTLAGASEAGERDGGPTEARFKDPMGLALLPDGNLVVADTGNHRIVKVTRDGIVRTLTGGGRAGHAGGGPTVALFDQPCGIVVDAKGGMAVAELGGGLRQIEAGSGNVLDLLASGPGKGGFDGGPTEAGALAPTAIAAAPGGGYYFADGTHTLRRIQNGQTRTLVGGALTMLADGESLDAGIGSISAIWADPAGDRLLVVDSLTHTLRLVRRGRATP